MNIVYMSQIVAEKYSFKADDIVISITEPNHRASLNLADPLSVLRLQFDDHDPNNNFNALMPEYAYDDQVLFTKDQALQIVNFVEANKEAKNVYVHCWAGISRSRAVVMALRQHYNLNMEPMEQWESANAYVYRLMTEVLTGHVLGSCFGEMDE